MHTRMIEYFKNIAIAFIFLAILCIVISFLYIQCGFTTWLIDVALVLATISGTLLVYSTLELQRKALNEEKTRHKLENFNAHFYPLLSSFRDDALKVEIIADVIGKNRRYEKKVCKGFQAFSWASAIVIRLKNGLKNAIIEFDPDMFSEEIKQYDDRSESLNENPLTSEDDVDKLDEDRSEYIKSQQIPYLMHKWGIKKDELENCKNMGNSQQNEFLLNLLLEHQPMMLAKYIQKLRFMLHFIEKESVESEKAVFYSHVSFLMSPEERNFLMCFEEFDQVTKNRY